MSNTLSISGIGYHLDSLDAGLDGMVQRAEAVRQPGPNEVLIRVRAASLNRRDLMILDRKYPVPASPGVVPLSDGAGEVVAVGEAVTRAKIGDRVAVTYFRRWIDGPMTLALTVEQHGASLGGMLAEYQVVDEKSVLPIPGHLSFTEAATLPCTGVLAWSALNSADRPLVAGDTVLTVGTGSVALFGIQLAAALGGRVISITSGTDKAVRLKELGTTDVINRRDTPDWEDAVLELTGGRGVDHVVEAVGPATLEKSIKSIGFNGQLALIGAFAANGAQFDPGIFLGRFFTIRRPAVGSRTSFEALNQAMAQHELRPVIDRVFDFAEAKDAYRYFRDGNPFGKVVITLP